MRIIVEEANKQALKNSKTMIINDHIQNWITIKKNLVYNLYLKKVYII